MMRQNQAVERGHTRTSFVEILGAAVLAVLLLVVGLAPPAQAQSQDDENTGASTCLPYVIQAGGTSIYGGESEETGDFGTSIYGFEIDGTPCDPPLFALRCKQLYVLAEYDAADADNQSCDPDGGLSTTGWPSYSCSLTMRPLPTEIPDDFCRVADWPEGTCGITIHLADTDVEFTACPACGTSIYGIPLHCPPPPFPPEVLEAIRQEAVNEVVAALESYQQEHRSYWVDGAGFKGRGTGWAFWQDDRWYSTSIASVLIDGGHLSPEPLALDDVMVYHCEDRVAVFTVEGIGQPSVEDSDWWTNNDCFRYPIDGLGATYFKLSPLLAPEVGRGAVIDEMVAALESYGDEHGTYWVEGSGFRGSGHGWAYWEDDSNYQTSIASVLIAGAHLSDDPLGTEDVMVYRCKNRVAVFTREGNGQASVEDNNWWTNNNCFRYPIDRLGAVDFRLSEEL